MGMEQIKITEKQAEVLKYILLGGRPTNLTIARQFQLKNTSSAQRRTQPLQKKKIIKNTGSGFISILNLNEVKKIIVSVKKEILFEEFLK